MTGLGALIARYGYLAVFAGTFLEGETVLVLAGFAAHRGYLALPGVLLAAFLGTVLGDQIYFWLGRRRGAAFLARRPRLQAPAARVRRWVASHANAVMWSYRFLYGVRTATPFVLGTSGVSPLRFGLIGTLGAAAWAGAVGLAGYSLGVVLERVLDDVERVEGAVFVAVALVGALLWALRRLRRTVRVPSGQAGPGA